MSPQRWSRARPSTSSLTSILFVIPTLFGGGAEYQLFELCKQLRERPEVKLRVCTFYSEQTTLLPGHYFTMRELGIEVDSLMDKTVTGWSVLWRLRRYLREHNASVVQSFIEANNYTLLASIGLRSQLFLGIRGRCDLSRPHRAIYRLLRRRISGVVGNSRDAVHSFAHQAGIPADKCRVIPNGFDPQRFGLTRSRGEIRAELDLPDDARVFVYVANMHFEYKGHDDLIVAFQQHHLQHPDDILVLVGSGDRRTSIEDLAQQLDCASSVRFLGWRNDVVDVLAGCDVYVSPSWTEGLSNATAEALLSGLPIIATDVGATKELVALARGRLVKPKDVSGLVAAMHGPPSALMQADRQNVLQRFSSARLAQAYLDLYRAEGTESAHL